MNQPKECILMSSTLAISPDSKMYKSRLNHLISRRERTPRIYMTETAHPKISLWDSSHVCFQNELMFHLFLIKIMPNHYHPFYFLLQERGSKRCLQIKFYCWLPRHTKPKVELREDWFCPVSAKIHDISIFQFQLFKSPKIRFNSIQMLLIW